MRGTVGGNKSEKYKIRITPACAGNRKPKSQKTTVIWDHPRVCGEQQTGPLLYHWFEGSPPRVRGTVVVGSTKTPSRGITPACAGNSPPPAAGPRGDWDHPRVCGEQWVLNHAGLPVSGSPPRVRGTALRALDAHRVGGITPACAGNRRISSLMKTEKWDHPRVCGEQTNFSTPCIGKSGSPPRVRGTDSARSARSS